MLGTDDGSYCAPFFPGVSTALSAGLSAGLSAVFSAGVAAGFGVIFARASKVFQNSSIGSVILEYESRLIPRWLRRKVMSLICMGMITLSSVAISISGRR